MIEAMPTNNFEKKRLSCAATPDLDPSITEAPLFPQPNQHSVNKSLLKPSLFKHDNNAATMPPAVVLFNVTIDKKKVSGSASSFRVVRMYTMRQLSLFKLVFSSISKDIIGFAAIICCTSFVFISFAM